MIADSDGRVILEATRGTQRRQLFLCKLDERRPVESRRNHCGWLIFAPTLDHWEAGTPEGDFLVSVSRATYISALAANQYCPGLRQRSGLHNDAFPA